MKKILLFLTTLLFATEYVAASIDAGKFKINRYENNSYCKIDGLSSSEKENCDIDYVLKIPAEITYGGKSYPVKGIEDNAFNPTSGSGTDCYHYIGTVDLSAATNLTTIGSYAFCGPSNKPQSRIKNIIWPTSKKLTTIKDHAFKNCVHLKSLILPEGMTTIGDYAFENTGLTAITIPSTISSLSTISSNAFSSIDGQYSLTINSKSIVENSYAGVTKRISTIFPRTKSIRFSSAVEKIGSYAFANCVDLKSVDLNNVTVVNTGAFTGCSALKSIDLKQVSTDENVNPENLDTIRISSTNTISITSPNAKHLIFSSNISTFPYNFFKRDVHYAVDRVTFENTNGVDIPPYAFYGISGNNFYFDNLKTVEGKIKTVGERAFYWYKYNLNIGPLTTIDLSSATSIGSNAFYCQALTSVNLTNVETISGSAFENCSNLTSIGVPDSWNVKSIGNSAFKGTAISKEKITFHLCETIGQEAFYGVNFEKIFLVDKCESVGDRAFANNPSLNLVQVYGNIAESAFQNCPNIENVTVCSEGVANPSKAYTTESNISRYFGTGVKQFNFYTENVASNALIGYSSVTTLKFGLEVKSIGDGVAMLCQNLETVNIHSVDGVNVGQGAFTGCSKLTTVSGKIGTLGTGAFGLCASLNNVDFENSTLDIPQEAFSGDVALKTINNVTVGNVGDQAFNGCTAFTGENMVFSGTTTLGAGAFKNCKSLKKIPCTDVVNIGDETFNGCSSMSVSESALSKVKTIGKKAFNGCAGISGPSGFTLPASIESIGDEAFKGSYMYISTLNLTGNNLKSLGKDAFIVGSLNIDCPTYLAKDFATTNNVLSSVKFQSGSELTIGPSVTAIGNNAFNNTASQKIEIKNRILIDSEHLTSLGNNSFKGLKTETFYIKPSSAQVNADKIKVEAKNLSIHSRNFNSAYPQYEENDNFLKAFSDSLENVNILNNYDDMAYIPRYAFYTTEGNKTNLKSISGYYYGVGYYAFANNQNLKSVNFELLQYIQGHAFENCSGLEIVDISNDNEKEPVVIEEYAFKGNSLKVITVHRGKIKPGARGDETCNSITVSPTAFEGQKPWLLMDMSDQVNVECNENTKVITNTEAKANEYRNRATNAPKYVTSIQRMECNPEDVDMNGTTDGRDAQAIYDR